MLDAANDVAAVDNDDESDDCLLQLPVVHVLLEHNANVDAIANGSITALGLAVLAGCAAAFYRYFQRVTGAQDNRMSLEVCWLQEVYVCHLWRHDREMQELKSGG